MRRFAVACRLACPLVFLVPAPARASAPAAAEVPLPIRRVVLFKTGIGYFEHLGDVRNRQDVTIRFNSPQLDDVLKSLTVLDLGKGQIAGITYNSLAPMEQRLGALRLPLDAGTTALQMLGSLRGARIEVTAGAGPIEGRLLAVEQRDRSRGDETTSIDTFSILTDAGELRSFELTPAVRVRVVDRDLRQEIGRYLDLVGSAREQDVRSLVISTSGSGDRPLFVSYVSEVPIWKSTYRLVLPAKGPPLLQGWAIVDNTIGEDWRDVQLSLVAGAPQSFIQKLSQPYYAQRPVVPMPRAVLLAPQTHQETLQSQDLGARQMPPPPAPARPSARDRAEGVESGVTAGAPLARSAPILENVHEQAADAEPMAAGSSLGDLFEYRITQPISVDKNQSALVPILSAEIAAEKVSLWNRAPGSGRPLRAVWLTNATGLTLDGGSMTLIDGGAFAGEGLIEALKPGGRRLLSYAADLGTLVDAGVSAAPGRVARLSVRDGIVVEESQERATWTYRARNENPSAVTLVIEHRVRPGWTLAPDLKPEEVTAGAARFRLRIEPASEATLEVPEFSRRETRIAVTDVDAALITRLTQSGVPAQALETALKPVLDKRAELAALDRRLQALQGEHAGIVRDQQRVRENMKALRGSAEERQLLQRYTRQLDEQETRLEALQQSIDRANAARATAHEELSALFQAVSLDLTAAP
jgi:hypothetical protein